MNAAHAESVPDNQWWGSAYAEFEDFVGIGEERVTRLAAYLRSTGESEFIVNRLLAANNLPHGPCGATPAPAPVESDQPVVIQET